MNLYGDSLKTFKVSEDEWEKLKSTKPFLSDKSGFYDNMLSWKINGNLENYRLYLHMVINNIDKVFPDNLWKHQYYLSRRSYFEHSYNKDGVQLSLKRPFGNSYVKGDILEALLDEYYTDKEKSYLSINFPEYPISEDDDDLFTEDMFQKTLLDLYEVFKSAISEWKWVSYNYDIYYYYSAPLNTFGQNYIENKLTDCEKENSLKCVNTYFLPSLFEIRQNNLKMLMD